jgi:hypothetical protein
MKHIKQICIVLVMIALAVGGYMAYKHYYAPQMDDVQVQLFNINSDGGSYRQGYDAGYNAAMNN